MCPECDAAGCGVDLHEIKPADEIYIRNGRYDEVRAAADSMKCDD
jgi:hypothetical protein